MADDDEYRSGNILIMGETSDGDYKVILVDDDGNLVLT